MTSEMLNALVGARGALATVEALMSQYANHRDCLVALGKEYGALVRAIDDGRRGAMSAEGVCFVVRNAEHETRRWAEHAQSFGWERVNV